MIIPGIRQGQSFSCPTDWHYCIYTVTFVKNIKVIPMAYTQNHEEENTLRRPLALLMAVLVTCMMQAEAMAATMRPKPVPVLMYHNITEPGGKGDELNVPADVFEDHIKHLRYYGFSTITLDQLYNYLQGDDNLPDNPLVITFDDGYISNYSLAMEPLKKYGFSAVMFMIGDRIGTDGYLDKDMLEQMQSSGVFDIQNHSLSHLFDLSRSGRPIINAEVVETGKRLEQILKKQVKFFCYPYGRHSKRLKDVLAENGYLLAFTTHYGVVRRGDDPLELDRLRVFGFDTGTSLVNRISRATGISVKPVFCDVSIDDPDFMLLIKAVDNSRIDIPVLDYRLMAAGLSIASIRYHVLAMAPIFRATTAFMAHNPLVTQAEAEEVIQ
jgi:peptidoglycan/xylan/chitin deacetylase (PgdA/CDA1 family)